MDSGRTKSEMLKLACERLRKGDMLDDGAMLKIAGEPGQIKSLKKVLIDLKYATEQDGMLSATALLDSQLVSWQLKKVQDYIFGTNEAKHYMKLMEMLTGLPSGNINVADLEDGIACRAVAEEDEPDPEVVKKYAKDFIDVSDIRKRQKVDE